MWEGGEVWILGGGPSVTEQFGIPDHIVEKVRSGESPPSVYSSYMWPLQKKHVIAINVAYLIGEWMDMVFFGDNSFFLVHKERLAKWPGLKVCCHQVTEKVPWIKFLSHDSVHIRGISPNPSCVSWNANSGAAAISVAANAGATQIILLGFDMNLNNSGNQHWHNLYKNMPGVNVKPQKKIAVGQAATFARHLLGFRPIAEDAKRRGITIINACPTSAIKEFPKCTVKELL